LHDRRFFFACVQIEFILFCLFPAVRTSFRHHRSSTDT
jgi:hypothetical protein